MLRAKEELEQYLKQKFIEMSRNKSKIVDFCESNYNFFNIPISLTSDYVSLRNPLTEANEFILYSLLYTLENVLETNENKISYYFTEKEIKAFTNLKFERDSLKFPYVLKVIKITEDQWIAGTDFKSLMLLREKQYINYEKNTQRPLKLMRYGDREVFSIDVNMAAVEQIAKLYKNNIYVPTTITLNIPLDSNHEIEFNEETSELIIYSLDRFDIIDGYHRYMAACKVCDNDKDFNFNMELRIVNFSESKAQQFIYQEEQKNVMNRSKAKTFDQTNIANRIINSLNTESQSNLQNLINRTANSLINYSTLSDLINYFFVRKINGEHKGNVAFAKYKKLLLEYFNLLTEYDIKYLNEKYTYRRLYTILCCFSYYEDNALELTNMSRVIDIVVSKMESGDSKEISEHSKIAMRNEVHRLLLEEI